MHLLLMKVLECLEMAVEESINENLEWVDGVLVILDAARTQRESCQSSLRPTRLHPQGKSLE